MSNVNPNHYKVAGRERQGDGILQDRHRQRFADNLARERFESRQALPAAPSAGPEDATAMTADARVKEEDTPRPPAKPVRKATKTVAKKAVKKAAKKGTKSGAGKAAKKRAPAARTTRRAPSKRTAKTAAKSAAKGRGGGAGSSRKRAKPSGTAKRARGRKRSS